MTIIVNLYPDPLIPFDKYHPPLSVKYSSTTHNTTLSSCELSYEWKKGDYFSIFLFLYLYFFNLNADIDAVIIDFSFIIYSLIYSYIPKKVYVNYKFHIWFSNKLKFVIK